MPHTVWHDLGLPTAGRHVLVVSPHLDDGVLSVGGTMTRLVEEGAEVVLATIFTAPATPPISPAARQFHDRCGLSDDAMQTRSAEDRASCVALRVRSLHLGLPEALYRRGSDGRIRYLDGAAIFQRRVEPETDVVHAVENCVRQLVAQVRPDLVVGPLAVGRHIDHVITRQACLSVGVPAAQVRWFEDLPYALYSHLQPWEDDAAHGLTPRLVPLSADQWHRKIDAVACYASQLEVLWYDPSPWRDQMRAYAEQRGHQTAAERLWSES